MSKLFRNMCRVGKSAEKYRFTILFHSMKLESDEEFTLKIEWTRGDRSFIYSDHISIGGVHGCDFIVDGELSLDATLFRAGEGYQKKLSTLKFWNIISENGKSSETLSGCVDIDLASLFPFPTTENVESQVLAVELKDQSSKLYTAFVTIFVSAIELDTSNFSEFNGTSVFSKMSHNDINLLASAHTPKYQPVPGSPACSRFTVSRSPGASTIIGSPCRIPPSSFLSNRNEISKTVNKSGRSTDQPQFSRHIARGTATGIPNFNLVSPTDIDKHHLRIGNVQLTPSRKSLLEENINSPSHKSLKSLKNFTNSLAPISSEGEVVTVLGCPVELEEDHEIVHDLIKSINNKNDVSSDSSLIPKEILKRNRLVSVSCPDCKFDFRVSVASIAADQLHLLDAVAKRDSKVLMEKIESLGTDIFVLMQKLQEKDNRIRDMEIQHEEEISKLKNDFSIERNDLQLELEAKDEEICLLIDEYDILKKECDEYLLDNHASESDCVNDNKSYDEDNFNKLTDTAGNFDAQVNENLIESELEQDFDNNNLINRVQSSQQLQLPAHISNSSLTDGVNTSTNNNLKNLLTPTRASKNPSPALKPSGKCKTNDIQNSSRLNNQLLNTSVSRSPSVKFNFSKLHDEESDFNSSGIDIPANSQSPYDKHENLIPFQETKSLNSPLPRKSSIKRSKYQPSDAFSSKVAKSCLGHSTMRSSNPGYAASAYSVSQRATEIIQDATRRQITQLRERNEKLRLQILELTQGEFAKSLESRGNQLEQIRALQNRSNYLESELEKSKRCNQDFKSNFVAVFEGDEDDISSDLNNLSSLNDSKEDISVKQEVDKKLMIIPRLRKVALSRSELENLRKETTKFLNDCESIRSLSEEGSEEEKQTSALVTLMKKLMSTLDQFQKDIEFVHQQFSSARKIYEESVDILVRESRAAAGSSALTIQSLQDQLIIQQEANDTINRELCTRPTLDYVDELKADIQASGDALHAASLENINMNDEITAAKLEINDLHTELTNVRMHFTSLQQDFVLSEKEVEKLKKTKLNLEAQLSFVICERDELEDLVTNGPRRCFGGGISSKIKQQVMENRNRRNSGDSNVSTADSYSEFNVGTHSRRVQIMQQRFDPLKERVSDIPSSSAPVFKVIESSLSNSKEDAIDTDHFRNPFSQRARDNHQLKKTKKNGATLSVIDQKNDSKMHTSPKGSFLSAQDELNDDNTSNVDSRRKKSRRMNIASAAPSVAVDALWF